MSGGFMPEAQEKELVEQYLKEHNLETILNSAINKVVRERPEKPFPILCGILRNESSADGGILHVEATYAVDTLGYPTLLVNLTTDKGVFEASVSSVLFNELFEEEETEESEDTTDEASSSPPKEEQSIGTKVAGRFEKIKTIVNKFNLMVSTELEGMNPADQSAVDSVLLNMTSSIGRIGVIATSIAVCKAGARASDATLYDHIASLGEVESPVIPNPLFSLMNGGAAGSFGDKLLLRDIFLLPLHPVSFEEAIVTAAQVMATIKEKIISTSIGKLGGISTALQSTEDFLTLVSEAIKAVVSEEDKYAIGIDVGADDFVISIDDDSGITLPRTYNLEVHASAKAVTKSSDELLEKLKGWIKTYKVAAVLNPFVLPGDLSTFGSLNTAVNFGSEVAYSSIGGDDSCKMQIAISSANIVDSDDNTSGKGLTIERLAQEHACNSITLDLPSCTTISSAISTVVAARQKGLSVIVSNIASHSYVMPDSFVAELAVGLGVGQVRLGGIHRQECVDQANCLLRLESEDDRPPFVSQDFRR